MSLYLIILLASISIPLSLSFERKIRFYKSWGHLWPAILIVAVVFIGFDIYLTNYKVWGFNNRYILGVKFFGLPLEEYLFFILIPYASLFLYTVSQYFFPWLKLSSGLTKYLSVLLILGLFILLFFNSDKLYTTYIYLNTVLLLVYSFFDKSEMLARFFPSFLVIMIPFMVVNGILTGSFIDEEVVWYNTKEILNIRLFTIPIEDVNYAFCMLYPAIVISEKLKERMKRKK